MKDDVPDHLKHWKDVPWEERFEIWAYPLAIVADRYGGTYSGGKWLAIAGVNKERLGAPVLKLLIEMDEGKPNPWGDDLGAGDFWADPPARIAAGDSPEKALVALKEKNANVNWPFDRDSIAGI